VEAWRFRTDGSFVRQKVFERDRGVCADCGTDTRALKAAIFEATGDYFGLPTQWQAHHIKAVSIGGGLCDLSGYATLCLVCHAKETALLKAKKDEARKRERIHQILLFLADWGGTTQEIVKATKMSKSRVSEYLKQMREAGLVHQSQRSARLFVTSTGITELSSDIR
jgi:DNA-binding transcriptional ArsR family regulator